MYKDIYERPECDISIFQIDDVIMISFPELEQDELPIATQPQQP